MRGCELEIVTESENERSIFRTKGVFESEEDGERVRYRIDNDDAELFFSEAFFENCRRGSYGLKARFEEGKESEIIIGSSSLKGKIPVKTTRYRLYRSDAERKIELCYELFSPQQVQTFLLKIKIVFFSEEK